MALSQPATFNEEWSDERVFAYLTQLPPEGVNGDFVGIGTDHAGESHAHGCRPAFGECQAEDI